MAATEARYFASPDKTVGALDAGAAASLVAAVSDVALVVDANGIIRDVAIGRSEQPIDSADWVGRAWADTVTVESRQKILELLDAAETGTAGRSRQVNYPGDDGPDVPVMYSAIRINTGGSVLAVGRDLRDVAALQRRLVEAQQAMELDYARLRNAELRYRLLFRDVSEAVVIIDGTNENVVDVNPAASALLQTGERDLVGHRFPVGFDKASSEAIRGMLASARAAGTAEAIRVTRPRGDGQVLVSASLFRQQSAPYFLVRIAPVGGEGLDEAHLTGLERSGSVIETMPDGFVVTDAAGAVLTVNPAFLEMVQLPAEAQARGRPLERWLGRPGVDIAVIIANLRRHGSVRLYTTQLRSELGIGVMVELSAVAVAEGDDQCFGFVVRNVGRRLADRDSVIGEQVPRSVEDLTELIGQVPLREIVRQTTDLIERLCIEAALELTNDNRASAAEMLGLSRQGLYTKLRRYGIGELESDEDS